jgi:glycosyltransferase involved in cell wall biosynthesis
MKYSYFVDPKNPNLRHCSDSFIDASSLRHDREHTKIERIKPLNITTSTYLIKQIIATKKKGDLISIFLFATQPDYILLLAIVRTLNLILRRDIKIYHLMHEPRYERGRASAKTSLLLYCSNWMMSRLADRIILSSQQALIKAESFIPKEKIVNINLVFASKDRRSLALNLDDLKQSWSKLKTISLIGIAAKDKNPEGFMSLANIANIEYPHKARFIRAGRDKDVKLDYDRENIIQFPGYITHAAKAFLLSLTHVMVIPYNFSTQSGVIIEAMSYGKLIIVNDIPSFSPFKGLKFVWTIDFNSSEQIANCLDRIFSMTADEYEQCCLAAIEYFECNYSKQYLAERLDELTI